MFQHGADPQVGDKPIAEVEVLEEREDGAYHESRLFDGLPPLILDGLRAGQYGQSFRMEILREEWVDKPDRSDYNPAALPDATTSWSATGIGRPTLSVALASLSKGGHIRVGMEDVLTLAKGVPVEHNDQLVSRVVELAKIAQRAPMPPAEAKDLLQTKRR